MKIFTILAACVGLAVCGLFIAHSSHSKPPIAYVYVVDYSASAADQRQGQLGTIVAELESAEPNTWVTVFRTGASTDEVFSGALDEASVDAVIASLKRATANPDHRRGTNFASMAEAIETHLNGEKGVVNVRILTDGGNDALDPKSLEAYARAARKVATSPHLDSLTFIGVRTGLREAIRKTWAVAGSKLRIDAVGQVSPN